MHGDVQRVLIGRQAIARRVAEVARQITEDWCGLTGDGAVPRPGPGDGASPAEAPEITLVPILTGSFIFVADLIRQLPLRMQIRLISVTSYPGRSTTSQGPTVRGELTGLPPTLAGAHVLLIDDILDSGQTLQLARRLIGQRQPASLRTCVLLRKHRPQALATPVDYVCFDIPDEFVVGYGLDFNDHYRNLPDIVTLRPQVIQGTGAADSQGGACGLR